jgi:hypothetical protein
MAGKLLDIIGDVVPTKKLRRVEYTRRGNTSELMLYSQISQLEGYNLDTFVRELNAWLQTTRMGNSMRMWMSYVLDRNLNTVSIYHTNVKGERDRLVCNLIEE